METSADPDVPAIHLLGPLEVSGGTGVTLTPRERAVLARLALDTGRAVPVDRLVDDLWGDAPPATARNALQVYVSHLRTRLGRDAVTSSGRGYRLELPDDRIDSIVFERLVAVAVGLSSSGRSREAVASLDAAGRLWRGDPLSDLAAYDFARTEAARLTELRATSLEHLAETLLVLDDLDRLTDEMGPIVRAFPFRERLRVAVMTGLYRQGRAVDALALYAALVAQLREELGLEPGPTIKALHRAILRDDPSLSASLPVGELTLVATVLDAPTSLENQLGDAYADAIREHRALVRTAFTAHSGWAVPTGAEHSLAVFATAMDAVRAAASVQRSLAAHRFPDAAVVALRIGVHTGRPRVVDQHYVGVDVRRVLQVAAAATDGQTLLTAEAATLLDLDALNEDGGAITDLGQHRLVDLPRPEHLHRLVLSDLPGDFPPPRTLGGRTSLPRSAVPLVGRVTALAALVEEMSRPGSGLTTILGPGGTGKTRLAIEVADRVGAHLAGGVFFVALDTTRTVPEVWSGVAAALGLAVDAPGRSAVLAQLDGRRTLLVLDNLEQLDGVAGVVEDLLATDGEVRILATSRTPCRVIGERLHQLDPLVDEPGHAEASALFSSYAALARPGFVLDDGNREAVARICRRVDGLPLGIELAAARVRQLPPHALADMLEAGHQLATGGPSRPSRQRDLHGLTDWSFRLLTERQQRLLELLSTFVGGVDLDTVARLIRGDSADPVGTTLELADASLVRISDDPSPRVTLLETVRDFAAQSLASTGHVETARDLHLEVHLEMARQLHLQRPRRTTVAAFLLRERGNVEAALDWALADRSRHVDAAAEILHSLGETWHQLGPSAFDYLERTASACPEHSPFRGWMTYWDYRRRWDTEVGDQLLLGLLEDAEARLRATQDTQPLAALLAYGGSLGADVGLGPDWAVGRAREAVSLAEATGDDWLLSLTTASLVRALVAAGRGAEAAPAMDQAREAAVRIADVDRLDALTMVEAELVAAEGRREEAWLLAAPAAAGLVSSRSEGSLWNATSTLARLAAHDRPATAARLIGVGLGALQRMGSTPGHGDLQHLRVSVAPAEAALGAVELDRLVEDGRSLVAETAVAWVLDLLGDATPA